MKYCTKCGAPQNNDAAAFCTSCGASFTTQQTPGFNAQPAYPAAGMPMNYWKALSQYVLYIFAGIFALLGILIATGTMWSIDDLGDYIDFIYEMNGSVQVWDIVTGLLLIGAAALTVLARFRLVAGNKQASLFMSLAFYIAGGISVLYFFFQFIAWDAPGMGEFVEKLSAPLIVMLLGFVWIGFGIFHTIYLGKRRQMLR